MTMRDNIAIKPQMKMERRHMTSSETMKHFVGEKRVNSSSLEERRDRLDILLAMFLLMNKMPLIQEKEHLKMVVGKIESRQPNVVEIDFLSMNKL